MLLSVAFILATAANAQEVFDSYSVTLPSIATPADPPGFIEQIAAKIRSESELAADSMSNYESIIPATGIAYEMVAIPGGSFLMGSPDDEELREETEGPQVEVTVSPFWMGKYEITWDQYEPFMINGVDRKKNGIPLDYDAKKASLVDGVSQPTPPYTEMSFGMGQRGFPAISMTHHAANKFCQWLSVQTGHFYRLPTEAEWEYACRAGTTTPYSFEQSTIEDRAWYYDTVEDGYIQVGQLPPNPFGLHDMHGNVMEWVADAFVPDYFDRIKQHPKDPYVRPERLYPRSARGGGWDDDPEWLRSAARRGSNPEWKDQDPQLPRSLWYHTDAIWLGFRIVRPLKTPSAEVMNAYWNSAAGMR
ncbi:MAG: formylglycine-generating enzyme family protein [Planctomycetota bacterium]